MRIAYISNSDPHDINNWSGTPYHIISALSKYHEVVWVGGGTLNGALWHHRFLNKRKPFNLLDYSEDICRVVSNFIKEGKYDIAISSTYSMCSRLDIDIPLIAFSDLTYNLCTTYLKHAPIELREQSMQIEQDFLQLADAIIYPSSFAKDAALADYCLRETKIHILDFGANIPTPMNVNVDDFDSDICKLVFVGRNWIKKGGDKALATYSILKSQGFPCELTIIGCEPLYKIEDTDVKVIPWLDKSKAEDMLCYDKIMRESHFLILPTEFDAYGIVLCEASAYGVPSLASNVGGVCQPVRDGINGFLFSPHANAWDYAEKIKTIFQDKKRYISLRKTTLTEFGIRLNWDVWANSVIAIMNRVIRDKQVKSIKENDSVKEKVENESAVSIDNFYIPVYAINLKSRPDRLAHVQQEFKNKNEFRVKYIEAVKHNVGAVGLWKSICKVVRIAQKQNEDIIILCEDDHEFTSYYDSNYFLSNIAEAYAQGAELLNGGIGGFGNAVPVAPNRSCVDWFWCTQFVVIFAPLFSKILNYDFKVGDTADGVLSQIANNPQVMFPPVSTQKDFGYSDITKRQPMFQSRIFHSCNLRLANIHRVYQKYLNGIKH